MGVAKKKPAPQRAGTKRISGDEAMRAIGGDPASLLLAIELMDRMLAKRYLRRKSRRSP